MIIAKEFDALLPGINGASGIGAEVASIAGGQWNWDAIYVTALAALTLGSRNERVLRTIIEGPLGWIVRPVAEIVYEREFSATEVLAGLV